MQVVYTCCAGLDVHKETVSVCISRCEAGGKKSRQLRVYGTFTKDLLALVDWLQENRVTQVAMEATGVYWRPVWTVLEGHFPQMLVNPQHIKAVPGRVDRRSAAARFAQGELCAPHADSGSTRSDALSYRTPAKPESGGQPHPEVSGTSPSQAQFRGFRRVGRVRTPYAGGDHRRARPSRTTGAAGAGKIEEQSGRPGASSHRTGSGPSPVSVGRVPG
jgi:hypothetical protein